MKFKFLEKIKEKYNSTDKKKLFIYIALVFVLLVIVWAFLTALIITKNFNRAQVLGNENRQELDVSSLILVETKDNVKYWEIYARSGNYDSSNKIATLNNVTGNFYQDNEVSMSFEAAQGTYNEEKQEIILNSRTFIVLKDGTSLHCDKLTWTGSDHDIIVNGNVEIQRDNEIISKADKGIISADYSKFKIVGKAVTKLYETKEKK